MIAEKDREEGRNDRATTVTTHILNRDSCNDVMYKGFITYNILRFIFLRTFSPYDTG